MNYKILCIFILFIVMNLLQQKVDAGLKKVIIHIPYHIKNMKHTHTIYKIIKHEQKDKNNYEDWKKVSTDNNKIILLIFVVILSKTSSEDDYKKRIHFKIHVPEIIRHHIHTKTVFIHVHEMKPHNGEKHNEENHVEDWASYNSYKYNNGLEESHLTSYNKKKQKNIDIPYDDYLPTRENYYQPFITPHIYNPPKNLLVNESPIYNENQLGIFNPEETIDERMPSADAKIPISQYEIHENVDEETPSNDINYQKVNHEEAHRYGKKTESGHVIHKNLKDFYDKENEEETFSDDVFEDENYNKYDIHGYRGKYDKEIGLEQRTGKKDRSADRRLMIATMVIR